VTAEHGGTGGRPLEGGMVIEEPDIEIGAGVSSKGKLGSLLCECSNPVAAISKRVPAEAGRGRGNYSGRGSRGDRGGRGGYDSNESRFRRVDAPPPHEPRHNSPRPVPHVAVPPAIPGFGFQLPGMPGGY
jgi:protein NRD1